MPKEKRSRYGSSFDRFPGFIQALDPSIKRHAQAKQITIPVPQPSVL
jgi:hypothetical protein